MKMDPEYKHAFKRLSISELKAMWDELAPARRTPIKETPRQPDDPMLNYVVRDCMVDDQGKMAIFCFQDTMLGRLERIAAGSLNLGHLGALIDYRSLLLRQSMVLNREIARLQETTFEIEGAMVLDPQPYFESVTEEVVELEVVQEPVHSSDPIPMECLHSEQLSAVMHEEPSQKEVEISERQTSPISASQVLERQPSPQGSQQSSVDPSQDEHVEEPSSAERRPSFEPVTPATPKSEKDENTSPNYNTQHFALPSYQSASKPKVETSDWESTNLLSTPMTVKEFVSPDEDHPTPLPINEQKRRRLMERLQQSRATGDAEKCLIQ